MRRWLKWLLLGVLSVVFGLFVLANPFAASLAIEQLVGLLFLLIGAFQIVAAFREDRFWSRIASVALGALAVVLGVSFLANPLHGVISLVSIVTIILAASGVVRIALAYRMKNTPFFWSMLISGGLSVLLALYIIANFGAVSGSLLGILMGIEMILDGFAMIALAFFARALGGPTQWK
ncbi:HdeD family acid-resistance protein [Pikeienuella sp. HZG-20]|uniref:HdeD family acid-resistance protein n=1 Tax=Paludibacillus litoralis TaxID=3133267 RepID=UPI0030EF3F9A